MQGRGPELGWLQSDFYRDRFRKTMKWLLISVIVMFVLIGAIIYVILFRPEPRYFANTTDGLILNMPPAVSS